MMTLKEDILPLQSDDGFQLSAFHCSPLEPSLGGLVLLQEIFGVTEQMKNVARRYARAGFDVIIPALFDRHHPGTVISFEEPLVGRDLAWSLDPQETALDVKAAKEAVTNRSGVSLMGFCWGGGQAYRLACELDFVSAISFYGTAMKDHLANCPQKTQAALLFHFGTQDDHTPKELIEKVHHELPQAKIELYETGHAFANEERPTYHPTSAEQAHQRTLDFLLHHHSQN